MAGRALTLFMICLVSGTVSGAPSEWMVGIGRIDITPPSGVWMAGYASRKQPADGKIHPLWAKALVMTDNLNNRAAIITLDLLGDNFHRTLADRIRTRISTLSRIQPHAILFNFSHTHSGPVTAVTDGALITYNINELHQSRVNRYTQTLEHQIVSLVTRASKHLQPAQFAFTQGQVSFARNRRTPVGQAGPVDHSVPVLKITSPSEQPLAVLFGYACHNTTYDGDALRFNGDYAGFAQIALEEKYPNMTAMFMMGCGGDINPDPRGRPEQAQQHGVSLAASVNHALKGPLHPVRGPLTTRLERIDLPYVVPPTESELESRRDDGDIYDQRLTRRLLKILRSGNSLPTSYPYPVQVIQFGNDLSLIALGGETVVDYARRLQRELAGKRIWIAGYSNEVFAYVPSERVLTEGGYEGGLAMKYFGIHGPFLPGLEARIIDLVKKLLHQSIPSNTWTHDK